MEDIATKSDVAQLGKKVEDVAARVERIDSSATRLDKKIDGAVSRLEAKMDKNLEDLAEIINKFAEHVDIRFNKVEGRLDIMAVDVNKIQGEISNIHIQFDRLFNTSSIK